MKDKDCVFCDIARERIIAENEYCVAFYDLYPVTEKHVLIIPKTHRLDYFDLSHSEREGVNELLITLKDMIISEDSTVTGFNIGINCGEDAGQTVFHCHIHLIPRRKGDMDNPRGGVRGVIPEKRLY
jgi:diadenosine tetraphosphate (Ap4A) HIT family hydrolase